MKRQSFIYSAHFRPTSTQYTNYHITLLRTLHFTKPSHKNYIHSKYKKTSTIWAWLKPQCDLLVLHMRAEDVKQSVLIYRQVVFSAPQQLYMSLHTMLILCCDFFRVVQKDKSFSIHFKLLTIKMYFLSYLSILSNSYILDHYIQDHSCNLWINTTNTVYSYWTKYKTLPELL